MLYIYIYTYIYVYVYIYIYIYNGILLYHKKDQIMLFAVTWVDLEILILSEVNQAEKDKYMLSLICRIF